MRTHPNVIASFAALLLLVTPCLRAEDTVTPPPAPPADKPEHHRGGPGAMMEHMAKELGLNPDQDAKWKAIAQEEKPAIEAIRADTSLSKEDRRAKIMEVNKTYAEQYRAVLNPDQQKKFDEKRAKMRDRGGRGDKPPGDKPPGDKPPGN